MAAAVKWLDEHNGLLTAIATVAIAVLTVVVARDANKQDVSSTGQLKVMQGQLDEMKSSSAQTDKLIVAATTQATAATNSVQAFVSSERGQLFVNSITLNKTADTDPNPTIDYAFMNVGHSPVVIDKIWILCRLVEGSEHMEKPDFNIGKVYQGLFTIGTDVTFGSSPGVGHTPSCVFQRPFTADDWSKIHSHTEFIFFAAQISYRDDFHSYIADYGTIYGLNPDGFTTSNLPSFYNQEQQQN